MNDHLWYLSGIKKRFHVSFWPDQSNQGSAHEDIWLEEDVVWGISRWQLCGWPSLISARNDLSNSGSGFCLACLADAYHQVSVQEDIWFGRCCLRLFSSLPSLISEWNISFILSLLVAWCLPLSFCSRECVGWKKLFEKFQEDCLVHDHLLYLSGMKEAFISLFLA